MSLVSRVSSYAGEEATASEALPADEVASEEVEPEMIQADPPEEEPAPAPRVTRPKTKTSPSHARTLSTTDDPGYEKPRSRPVQPVPDEGIYSPHGTRSHGGGCSDGSCSGGRGYNPYSGDSCMDGSCYDDSWDDGGYGWGGGDRWGPNCGPLFPRLHDRLYLEADYLMWWTRGDWVPELVTTGDSEEEAVSTGRTRLFGGEALNDEMRSGVKFKLGTWLNPCQDRGVEFTYLFLGQGETDQVFNSEQEPVLVVPYQDVLNNYTLSPLIIADPEIGTTGRIRVSDYSEFYTLEANYRRRLLWSCGARMDMLVGYRFARLGDDLILDTQSSDGTTTPPYGSMHTTDEFKTGNSFNGVQLGFTSEWRRNCWTLQMTSKLAMGNTHSTIDIRGTSDFTGTEPNPQHGLLAVSSNIGQYERDSFSVMPEIGFTLGYDFTQAIRGTLGYNFMYWSRVVRAGRAIDTELNPNETGPPPVTTTDSRFTIDSSDWWAQGLSFGLECRY